MATAMIQQNIGQQGEVFEQAGRGGAPDAEHIEAVGGTSREGEDDDEGTGDPQVAGPAVADLAHASGQDEGSRAEAREQCQPGHLVDPACGGETFRLARRVAQSRVGGHQGTKEMPDRSRVATFT